MKINNNLYLQPFMLGSNQNTTSLLNTPSKSSKQTFADMLQETTNDVKFSRHALERLENRQINLTKDDINKLNSTVDKMAQKGSREALVYMQGTAFVVSVKNRTVITAMDGVNLKDNIFTNIDSAAII